MSIKTNYKMYVSWLKQTWRYLVTLTIPWSNYISYAHIFKYDFAILQYKIASLALSVIVTGFNLE